MSDMNYTRGFDKGEKDNSCFQLVKIREDGIREIFVNVYGEDAEYLNNVFTQRDRLRKALKEIQKQMSGAWTCESIYMIVDEALKEV